MHKNALFLKMKCKFDKNIEIFRPEKYILEITCKVNCSELRCTQSQIWQHCGLNVGILGTQSQKYV